jgi:hypothetical protein
MLRFSRRVFPRISGPNSSTMGCSARMPRRRSDRSPRRARPLPRSTVLLEALPDVPQNAVDPPFRVGNPIQAFRCGQKATAYRVRACYELHPSEVRARGSACGPTVGGAHEVSASPHDASRLPGVRALAQSQSAPIDEPRFRLPLVLTSRHNVPWGVDISDPSISDLPPMRWDLAKRPSLG